jgi:hypothetical protein
MYDNNSILVILQNKTHSSYYDYINGNENYNNRTVIVKCHKLSGHFCVSLCFLFLKAL